MSNPFRVSSCSASLRRMMSSSSCGSPYRAKPVESGPRCLSASSMAVISCPIAPGLPRWISPAIPHITYSFLRQVVEIHLRVPLGDGGHELLPLVALVVHEH